MQKYNTQIRRAISDAYVECSKEKQKLLREHTLLYQRLMNEKDKISYKEYINLQNYFECISREIEDLSIRLDTWDKAREICLNIIGGEE